MGESINVEQKAALGAKGTIQIAEQNNYYGMTPEQASKLTMDLFMDNFPKLQELAATKAKQRAEELTKEFLSKLSQKNITDLSPFSDPDVQFILWEAHRDYARLGTQERLSILSNLMVNRIQCDKNFYIKTIIDHAFHAVNYLTPQHLDYLSALFILREVKIQGVNSLETLSQELKYIDNIFKGIEGTPISLLISLGCLEIKLWDVTKNLSKVYNVPIEEVKKICPVSFTKFHFDYGPSHIGIILAIANAQDKCRYKFQLETWIS